MLKTVTDGGTLLPDATSKSKSGQQTQKVEDNYFSSSDSKTNNILSTPGDSTQSSDSLSSLVDAFINPDNPQHLRFNPESPQPGISGEQQSGNYPLQVNK